MKSIILTVENYILKSYEKLLWGRKNNNPGIPMPLKNEHIDNAHLVTDRISQLKLLPKNGIVAEIGVYAGNYSEKILNITNPKKLFLIEINKNHCNKLKKRFKHHINNGTIEIMNISSFEAHKYFDNKFFDFVYIDADHSYQGVKKDILNFSPKVKDDGFIICNDYIYYDYIAFCYYGVMQAVNEFCNLYGWKICYYTLSNNDFKDVILKKI